MVDMKLAVRAIALERKCEPVPDMLTCIYSLMQEMHMNYSNPSSK